MAQERRLIVLYEPWCWQQWMVVIEVKIASGDDTTNQESINNTNIAKNHIKNSPW